MELYIIYWNRPDGYRDYALMAAKDEVDAKAAWKLDLEQDEIEISEGLIIGAYAIDLVADKDGVKYTIKVEKA